ncbi:MAG TPA: hypothetical protein VHR66_05690 [Gemmataceae bacterium]|jgi:hypothetical protein|nr:hypothetical protein [Gemmataceae bacterium]
MSPTRLLPTLFLIAALGPLPAGGQDPKEHVLTRPSEDRRDLTLIRRVSERTFVHDAAGVSFTVPAGWTEIPPHPAARKLDRRSSTLLGAQHSDRAQVASLVWTELDPGARTTDWVRETPAKGEYGEEYETLKAVYGAGRVTVPVRFRSGPFDVYRIDIRAGPGVADQAAGTLFVFFVESRGTTWLLKARVTSTRGDRHEADSLAVLAGYALVSATSGETSRKTVDVGTRAPPRADPTAASRGPLREMSCRTTAPHTPRTS